MPPQSEDREPRSPADPAHGRAAATPRLSVIVPIFNEESTIEQVLRVLLSLGPDLEVLAVNDASRDATAKVLEGFAREPRVRVLSHAQNAGKGRAIRTGLAAARGAWIAIQDADVELDPREIPRSVAWGEERGLDVVLGSRFLHGRKGASFLSILANWFLTALVQLLFWTRITDMETGHKVFRREVVEGMRLEANRFDFEPEFVCRVLAKRVRIGERAIGYAPRGFDEGKGIGWRDGIQAIATICKWRWRTWIA